MMRKQEWWGPDVAPYFLKDGMKFAQGQRVGIRTQVPWLGF